MQLKVGDNVAVCLHPVAPGVELIFGEQRVTATMAIPTGHKIALRSIAPGELVCKYGQTIGMAGSSIAAGEHVHVHNVEGTRGRGDLAEAPQPAPAAPRGIA